MYFSLSNDPDCYVCFMSVCLSRQISRQDLVNYISTHYTGSRIVLAGAGGECTYTHAHTHTLTTHSHTHTHIHTHAHTLTHIHTHTHTHTHTHPHTHTHKKKKPLAALVGHAFLVKPGHLCTKQVRCAGAMQTPGARARSSQEY